MYVASKSDKDWLLNEQRKLYRRSWVGCDLPASRNHLWRARCVSKGARRVRRGALGDLPARSGKAPSVHSTPNPDFRYRSSGSLFRIDLNHGLRWSAAARLSSFSIRIRSS